MHFWLNQVLKGGGSEDISQKRNGVGQWASK
jgi:hypothetical protein